eukprot:s7514_g1.t1
MPSDLWLSLPQEESPMSADLCAPPGLSMPADLGAPPGLSLPQDEWPMPADLGFSLPQEESPMSAHLGAPPGLSMPVDLGAPPGLSLPQARQAWTSCTQSLYVVAVAVLQHGRGCVGPVNEVMAVKAAMASAAEFTWSNAALQYEDELHMNRCLGYHDPTEDFKGDETRCSALRCKDKASGGHSDIELQSVVGFNAEGFHSDGVHDKADFDNDCLPVLTSMYCYQRGDDGVRRDERRAGEDASSAEQAANAALAELELEVEDERVEMEAEIASLTRRAAALGHEPERR